MITKYKITAILCFIFSILLISGFSEKIPVGNGELVLDWRQLPYHDQSENAVIESLGKPDQNHFLTIQKSGIYDEVYRPLQQFIPANAHSVRIKELVWKQDSFLVFYWFIKKGSDWISVYGIMYDPDRVEF